MVIFDFKFVVSPPSPAFNYPSTTLHFRRSGHLAVEPFSIRPVHMYERVRKTKGKRAVGETTTVKAMAFMRFASSIIEFSAALFMLHIGRVEAAMNINGLLGLVGPIAFFGTTMLGITALAGQLPLPKLLMIIAGVMLIFAGTRG